MDGSGLGTARTLSYGAAAKLLAGATVMKAFLGPELILLLVEGQGLSM